MSSNESLSSIMCTLLILISGAIFYWTSGMTPGAELFPRIMAGGLGLFGLVELILVFSKLKRDGQRSEKNQPVNSILARKSIVYMGAFFLLVVVFFIVLPFVGFAVASVIFMFISMVLIGGKKAVGKWYLALLVPGLIILAFQYGLDVRLPTLSLF